MLTARPHTPPSEDREQKRIVEFRLMTQKLEPPAQLRAYKTPQFTSEAKKSNPYISVTDYSSEMKQFKTSDAQTQFYSLPDGQTVDISSEMITTPEPLFNPETLLGADDTIASQLPIHKLVNNAFARYIVFLMSLICHLFFIFIFPGYITNQFNDHLPVCLLAQFVRALHRYCRCQGSNLFQALFSQRNKLRF